jgi:hypothetical protein
MTVALIGLNQESYTVNEVDGSVMICIVFLMNSGIQSLFLSIGATLSTEDGTAIGIVTLYHKLLCTTWACVLNNIIIMLSIQLLKTMSNHYHQVLD